MPTTEKRLLRSTAAAYGSQFGRTLLRLTTDLILARLILPEDHGLFALAWSAVVMAGFFRDLGLPYELVRHHREPYGSVLLWEIGAGLVVMAALMVGSPLFGGFDPRLPAVVRVLALYVLIEALAVVPRVFFERRLAVTRLVVPEISRGVLLAAVSIAMASQGFGVWSFVTGELVAATCFVGMLWWRARGQMPLDFDPAALPRLLKGSSLLFLIALFANSTPLVGRYIVEIVANTFMVGQFEKSFLWAFRTQVLLVPALVRALYPALVAYRQHYRRFVRAYHLGTVAIVGIEAIVAYTVFFNTEIVLLEILLGKNWGEAVHLIRILCFLPLLDPFSRLGGEMLKVRRQDRAWLLIAVLNLACLVGFGWILGSRYGAAGMAWAHYLMLGQLLMAWRVYKICGAEFWQILRNVLFVVLMPLPLFGAAAWLFPAASWSRFAASVVAAGIAGALLLGRFARPFRAFFANVREGEASEFSELGGEAP